MVQGVKPRDCICKMRKPVGMSDIAWVRIETTTRLSYLLPPLISSSSSDTLSKVNTVIVPERNSPVDLLPCLICYGTQQPVDVFLTKI